MCDVCVCTGWKSEGQQPVGGVRASNRSSTVVLFVCDHATPAPLHFASSKGKKQRRHDFGVLFNMHLLFFFFALVLCFWCVTGNSHLSLLSDCWNSALCFS